MYIHYDGYINYNMTQINLANSTNSLGFAQSLETLFNTWVGVGYCPECQSILYNAYLEGADQKVRDRYTFTTTERSVYGNPIFTISIPWIICFIICTILLLVAGIFSVIVESVTVAPDTLGYVSSVARNSRYLHVKPTSDAMTGPERARKLADTQVMMQDVKANAGVGKIALGLVSDKAVRLQANRMYR
jgi:hypothetical protein